MANPIAARPLHNTAQKDMSSAHPMNTIDAGKYGRHPHAPHVSLPQFSSNTNTSSTPLSHQQTQS
jgi:hypothetical protein